ncbi:glycosyltransferase family 2 protein [Sphingobacterium sp. CZ-UAM]|uniref:glycosyltransferase family 2 protein n=1 Tax=Sphingobacterium sp. CZ-UAM TaxID=1933868 RepID=UPI00158AAB18|nr:glycosyltransferase family 2 protein [Sphingobacterium sp. CZ-UAM]
MIVPIYKVEPFIARNAQQLFQQELDQLEYIFVDDCSPDNSIEVLEQVLSEYPDKRGWTKIIRHPVNKGLPSARNTGLDAATGEFIFHCDSDDWLDSDALKKLYNKAKQDNADAVWCDWYLSFSENERYMRQAPPQEGPISGRQCVELMLRGHIRYNVWNKLVRRSLYEQSLIRFPNGYAMGEDMTMISVLASAAKVSYLPEALYHYVQLNMGAFTKNTSELHLRQIRYNVEQTQLALLRKYGASIMDDIQFFKLNVKLPFLISQDTQSYQRWLDWYTEANDYIPLNPMFGKRIRFIQYAAIKKQFWILKLHYYLLIRLLYGVIYK